MGGSKCARLCGKLVMAGAPRLDRGEAALSSIIVAQHLLLEEGRLLGVESERGRPTMASCDEGVSSGQRRAVYPRRSRAYSDGMDAFEVLAGWWMKQGRAGRVVTRVVG